MRAPWTIHGLGVVAFGVLAWTGSATSAGPDDEVNTATLSHKAQKKWGINLPAEHWITVDWSIALSGGLEFPAEQTGAQKLSVDTNGDEKLDDDVKGKGGSLTLKGTTDADEKVEYTVRLRPKGKTWEWSAGSVQQGTVEGTKVSLIDMNGNGRYDDFGQDAYLVGNSSNAAFLSRVVNLGGNLYEFTPNALGTEVTTKPFTGETVMLDATSEFEGKGKVVNAVFRDGDLSFNVADEAKGMKIPAGTYRFEHGYVTKGSSTVTIGTGNMEPIELAPGAEHVVEWGAPIGGEFSYNQTGTKVTVNADFRFFGKLGEEYKEFTPKGGGPKIFVKDKEKGDVLTKGRFRES
ncbi:MAG: hypothetical protein WD226_12365 [Planctomycetota bacterium]